MKKILSQNKGGRDQMISIKKRFFLFFLISTLTNTIFSKDNISAITYHPGARLGDNLRSYFKAKWIAHRYGLKFLYTPFKYSPKLMISKIDKKYTQNMDSQFSKKIKMPYGTSRLAVALRDKTYGYTCRKGATFDKIKKNSNILYVSNGAAIVNIDWDDKIFVNRLKKSIAPIKPLKKPEIPSNIISVALHVRKGGGFDPKHAARTWPLKFPPDSYYIEQIKRLYKIVDKQPLYIHLFTDDKNPQKIAEKYKKALNIKNIVFTWREQNNAHNKNVIEDLFSMTHYDCLIRSQSHFGMIADILGNFNIVIFPENKYHWKRNQLIIDKVRVRINKK